MELEDLRNEIDKIDRSIVKLFEKRMKIVTLIADYKRKKGLPVLDSKREDALLGKMSQMSDQEFKEYTLALYSTILDISKTCQQKHISH